MTARSSVGLSDLGRDATDFLWEDVVDRFRGLMPFVPPVIPSSGPGLCAALSSASGTPLAPTVLVLARAFHRTRDALCEASGVARSGVRPDTQLDVLFPVTGMRRATWSLVAARLRCTRFPRLTRSAPLGWALAGGAVAGGAALTAWAARTFDPSADALGWLALTATALVACGLATLARRWAVHFQKGSLTVGDLARAIVVGDAPALALPHDRLSCEQIDEVMRELLRPYTVRARSVDASRATT